MARIIDGRLTLSGKLETLTPLHVGGHGDDVDADLPLARNGAGHWYIPGTSFSGALRDWCRRAFDNDQGETQTRSIWGFQDDSNQKEDKSHSSYVYVADAEIPETIVTEIRDGVGIDREWGCAANQIKYDRAIVPRGTELNLRITVELTEQNSDFAVLMFASLKKALERGEIQLGATKTRGLGRVRLVDGKLVKHGFKKKKELLAFLKGEAGTEIKPASIVSARHPRLVTTIYWEPVGPLMVKAGADGVSVDILPLMSRREGGLSPVLPGSSVKGVFRSQAERIVRTVTGIELPEADDDRKRFLLQVETRTSENDTPSLIEMLFGSAGRENANKEPIPRLGRGALSIDDCYASTIVEWAKWQPVATESLEPAPGQARSPFRQALDNAKLKDWTAAYHVAIDRWAGGAAESFLYTILEPRMVAWDTLRLELDFARLNEEERKPALTLFLLLLRDLASDRLPLGYATHRGMGTVRVKAMNFATQGEDSFVNLFHNHSLADLPAELKSDLATAWKTWIKDNRKVEKSS